MRLRSILSEALRNIASGTTRAGTFALILLILGAGLLAADIAETRSLIAEAGHYQGVGASTVTLTAPDRVDGQRCESLNGLPGVQGAGAMKPSALPLSLAALPGAPMAQFEVTRSFSDVLGMSAVSSPGILISEEVSTAVQRSRGDDLPLDGATARIQGVFAYPTDGRRPGMGWAALVPSTARERFDECWVRQWPEDPLLRTHLLQVVMPGTASDGEEAVIAQLNATLGTRFTGAERFEQRLLRLVPVSLYLSALLLGMVSVRLRRLELASNLHAGARRRDIQTQIIWETVAWSGPAAIGAFGAAVLMAAPVGQADRLALIAEGGNGAVAVLAGCIAGAWTMAATIRQRHFFTYFKDRS